MINILEDKNILLTEQQKTAVNFYSGMLLMLACPGSGKTTSTVSRCANLIVNYNVQPKHICNITFSLAAAKEMGKKFEKIFPELEKPLLFIH